MFHDYERFSRITVLAIIGVLCLTGMAGSVSAQEHRTGSTITIGPDETHEGDLETTAGEVVVAGTVDGDLTATGGSVTITGSVTGDLTATGGDVFIDGDIEGALTATGGDVYVRENATIGGTVDVTAGTISIAGSINGETQLDGDSITVGPTAVIDGDLAYRADNINLADEAEITGTVAERDDFESSPFSDISMPDIPDWAVTPLLGIYFFLANFVLGAVLLLGAPRFSERVTEQGVTRPVTSSGIGLATLIGTPIVIGALLLTLVGIPLAFFAGYSFFFILWVGLVYGAFVVGTWGLSLFDHVHRWGALTFGLALASLVGILPYVGILLIAFVLVGIGALVRALYDWRFCGDGDDNRPQRSVPASAR